MRLMAQSKTHTTTILKAGVANYTNQASPLVITPAGNWGTVERELLHSGQGLPGIEPISTFAFRKQ